MKANLFTGPFHAVSPERATGQKLNGRCPGKTMGSGSGVHSGPGPNHLLSPKPDLKIAQGKTIAEIPIDACKAYPIRIFEGLSIAPRIAVADRNTRNDDAKLMITLIPGCKTAPHPQIGFIVKGPYHMEQIAYAKSNPFDWATWIELYIDAKDLGKIIDGLIRLQLQREGIQA